jgi:DNA helicase II / ATP-dependent DNA helicase PcrA
VGDRSPGAQRMTLSDQQRAVVDADGNFLLLACPGSGKTRSATERTARLVRSLGSKIAVCSYTNVGTERISFVLATDLGVVLDREHFLGTIHRFLLRYVVHPYAHLMGAERGPFIHAGDWPDVRVHGDNAQRISLDKFRYAADGALVAPRNPRGVKGTAEEVIASVGKEVSRRKRGFFTEAGIVSANDAMWIALTILRRRSDVAAAVAGRFDEILLDEAQDTCSCSSPAWRFCSAPAACDRSRSWGISSSRSTLSWALMFSGCSVSQMTAGCGRYRSPRTIGARS